MGIYNPRPFFSENDRRLLQLLSQLILEAEGCWNSNKLKDAAHLSDSETVELIQLLREFLGSKRFRQTEFFLEEMFSGRRFNDARLREIFLQWRAFHGRSRAIASGQWRDFLNRLGGTAAMSGETPYWYRSPARPMDMEYFYRMEGILCDAADVHPEVRSLILSYVRRALPFIEQIRSGDEQFEKGSIAQKPKALLIELEDGAKSKVGSKPVSTKRIAAVATIVMDLSAAYTTRDWSVAAIFSTIAGAAPNAIFE